MYEYDAEAKKLQSPDGKLLTGNDVLNHLNQMFAAMANMHYAWGVLSEGVSIMDGVFLGSTTTDETVEDEAVEPEAEVEAEAEVETRE